MLLRLALCVPFSIYNCVTDQKTRRIRNQAVLLFALLGAAVQLIQGSGSALLSALAGGAVPLLLLPLFALRMLGAGDIKALMAIGIMCGFPASGYILAYSIIGGGILALALLLLRRNGRQRIRTFWRYCKLCFFSMKLQPYSAGESSGQFCFSYGILAGVVIYGLTTLL